MASAHTIRHNQNAVLEENVGNIDKRIPNGFLRCRSFLNKKTLEL